MVRAHLKLSIGKTVTAVCPPIPPFTGTLQATGDGYQVVDPEEPGYVFLTFRPEWVESVHETRDPDSITIRLWYAE
ncbi:MAG: hypothetical protein L0332_32970 [Chloroflexi bacterium]|nr:hypothetical protein [Chloroflexota bacterium]